MILNVCVVGRVDEAVFAAVSASLLNPNDDTSRHNMRYYESIKEEHQLSEADFNPRDDAKKFYLRREALKDLLIIRNTFGDQDDEVSLQNFFVLHLVAYFYPPVTKKRYNELVCSCRPPVDHSNTGEFR